MEEAGEVLQDPTMSFLSGRLKALGLNSQSTCENPTEELPLPVLNSRT